MNTNKNKHHVIGPISITDHHNQPGADRFKTLFRSTWLRIPMSARRKMLAHWREGVVHLASSPSVWLAPYETPGDGVGECRGNGHELVFDWSRLAEYPAEEVATVIAHELAHVVQRATGEHHGLTVGELEQFADEMIEDWGFSSELSCEPAGSWSLRYMDQTLVA